jgi:hypothetical protein
LAFRILNGQLWIEPFKVVYNQSTILFNIGEIKQLTIEQADNYFFNEVEVGSPIQDYRHTSGRLEFNTTNKFSVTQYNIKQALSLVSKYRLDSYGVTFIQLDYQNESTEDNSGDTTVFLLDIKNERDSLGVAVENFTDITVNNAPLAPIITYPFSSDTIRNNLPTIRGLATPSTEVFIYVDGNLDGSVFSDINGNWRYDIITPLDYYVESVTSGNHLIQATFTDLTGTYDSRNILLIDEAQATIFSNIHDGDNLYNNKPAINGVAEPNLLLQVLLDGVNIGNTTSDGSGRWFFQMPVMTNAVHTITVGATTISVNIFSFVELPLITSFADGFQLINNLPLVEGVAIPGTKVDLWLDYYPDVSIGTAFADVNGNWSIQSVPLFHTDGVTVLTPIPNGNHILSTSLAILSTKVNISGYILNRPDYTSISGVIDNTVFNTKLSPKEILLKRMSFFKSVFYQQPNTLIRFESGDKNQQFSRTIDGVTIKENDNIKISDYEDESLFLPIIIKAKVNTPSTFIETMDNFSSGGLIQAEYQGADIYALPIGDMVVDDITNEMQDWNLLLSVKTPLSTLLKLSSSGSTFKVMEKSIHRSDYNMLHFVEYNFTKSGKYISAELYQDWFENRNNDWRNNPFYIQKIQTIDGEIRDQIITSGVSGTIVLQMYVCKTAALYRSFNYAVVVPQPLPMPDVVQEVIIDWGTVDAGDYFFVMYASGNPFAISERIRVAAKHEGTILIDANNTKNKTGVMFSTGFRSVLRIEGFMRKLLPDIENIVDEDEVGDFRMTHAVSTKKRIVLIGDPKGTPDYMYLKVAPILSLDSVFIEGTEYVLDKGANFEPQEQVQGYPMYHFSVDVRLKENEAGHTFASGETGFDDSVVLVVDAGAFGMGGGGLVQINLDGE